MSCVTDFSVLCGGGVTSTHCVTWQGKDIPCLGIVKGDSLTKMQEAIADELCSLVGDADISTITLCGDFVALIGSQDKNLGNLLQILFTYGCTLKGLIDSLETQVTNNNNLTLDFKCLNTVIDPCVTNTYTVETVLQILINNICALSTRMTTLETSITNTVTTQIGTILGNAITSCQTGRIAVTGSGATTKVTFKGFVPPHVAMEYYGPLTYFDATGKGMDNTPLCGWYLCNGLNGTPDRRGRVGVGAINAIGGGALHTSVDPSLSANQVTPSANYSVGDTGGKIKTVLGTNNLPNHTHPVTDPGHKHNFQFDNERTDDGGNFAVGDPGWLNQPNPTTNIEPNMISVSQTGITIGSTGGGEGFDNRMPFIACAYIMMIL